MISDKYRDRISEIKDLYNTAESDMKNIGRVNQELIVAGVNQCRYVGQHLLRALTAETEEKIEEELTSAKKHAQRAIYDISDSGIQYYVNKIEDVLYKNFPTVDFSKVVANYGDIRAEITEAKTLTEATVTNLENREGFYQDARNHVDTLRRNYELLIGYSPDFVREVKKDNRDKVRTWASMAIASFSLLGVVVGLLTFLYLG